MVRSRRMFVSVLLAGLLVLSVSGASAVPAGDSQGRGKAGRPKPRLTWLPARVEQTLAPGQSETITAELVSNVSLENVSLRIPGGLNRIAAVKPSGPFSLTAGQPVQVEITLSLPADAAHSQGGVVQVVAGRRKLTQSLKVLVKVPGDTTQDTLKAPKSKHDQRSNEKGSAKAKDKQRVGASNQ